MYKASLAAAVLLTLAGCTKEDQRRADQKLEHANEQLKKDVKEAAREVKKDVHKAASEIRKDAHQASQDINKGAEDLKHKAQSK